MRRGAILAMLGILGAACGARTPLRNDPGPGSSGTVHDDGGRPTDDRDARVPVPGDPRDAGPDATIDPPPPPPPPPPDAGGITPPPDVRPRALVSAGWRHTCAVIGYDVWCWGFDESGQVGGGISPERVLSPIRVDVGGPAVEVAAGLQHSCALLASGGVKCWGGNDLGQLGDGTTSRRLRPVTVLGVHDAVRVAVGGEHSCALRLDGQVWCWGHNGFGQLGGGTGGTSTRAFAASGLDDAVDLVAGRRHTCAVRRTGELVCWGAGAQGQLGLRDRGDRFTPTPVPGYGDVRSVAAGAYHTCAVMPSGLLDCWGSVVRIGSGDGVAFTLRPVPGIPLVERASGGDLGATCVVVAGEYVRCAAPTDCGGEPYAVRCTTVQEIGGTRNATGVSVGYEHGCATLDDGWIACWGSDEFGQRGDGPDTGTVSYVATRIAPH